MLQPQAPELEETILGACLIEKEGMALVDELLKPEMFYVTRHQLIYAALQAMFSKASFFSVAVSFFHSFRARAMFILSFWVMRW
jgi:replicative DNA helicase